MSGLTHRQFAEIAAALKRVRPRKDDAEEYKQWRHDVRSICRACKKFNPGFNPQMFLDACGVEKEDGETK